MVDNHDVSCNVCVKLFLYNTYLYVCFPPPYKYVRYMYASDSDNFCLPTGCWRQGNRLTRFLLFFHFILYKHGAETPRNRHRCIVICSYPISGGYVCGYKYMALNIILYRSLNTILSYHVCA